MFRVLNSKSNILISRFYTFHFRLSLSDSRPVNCELWITFVTTYAVIFIVEYLHAIHVPPFTAFQIYTEPSTCFRSRQSRYRRYQLSPVSGRFAFLIADSPCARISRDRSTRMKGMESQGARIPRRYALSVEIVSGGIEISQRVNDTACRAHSSALIRSMQGGSVNALSAVLYRKSGEGCTVCTEWCVARLGKGVA